MLLGWFGLFWIGTTSILGLHAASQDSINNKALGGQEIFDDKTIRKFGKMGEGDIDTTSLNRQHFDEQASTYNTRWQKTIEQLIVEIRKKKEWIGVDWAEDDEDSESDQSGSKSTEKVEKKSVRLLDYACGTGLVSRALLPYITSTTGIDLSSAMVQEFNNAAANQGLSPSEMHAYNGNLISPSPTTDSQFSGGEFYDFDVAVVGLGFHHFDDPFLAAKRLTERLKVGGALVIIDFLPHGPDADVSHEGHSHSHSHSHHHGGHSHGHGHGHSHHGDQGSGDGNSAEVGDQSVYKAAKKTVIHHGFSVDDVKRMFEEAGAGKDFELLEMGKGVVFSKGEGGFKREVFIARGFKA